MKRNLLSQLVGFLNTTSADSFETVQINETTYDDGSVGITVELTFPAKRDSRDEFEFKPEVSD